MLAEYEAASGGGAGAYGLQGETGSLEMVDAPMVSSCSLTSPSIHD